MKRVTFDLFGHGKSKDEAIQDAEQVFEKLKESCETAGLALEGKYTLPVMNSGVRNRGDDYKGGWQAVAHLAIPKSKNVTYPEIYKLVNSVQVCIFKIENN